MIRGFHHRVMVSISLHGGGLQKGMDIKEKLAVLADAAKYDASCASSGGRRKRPEGGIGNAEGMGICHSYTPDGRCVSLLKILLTNFCIYDCSYCVNRISSATRRARFTPQEVVWLTLEFYKRNYIEGLFLSSGVDKDADSTMERLIEVARTLREEHGFGGYIHLKAVAGASKELIERAGLWADRLSANIELPTPADLVKLAPAKTHEQIEASMAQIAEKIAEHSRDSRVHRSTPKFAAAGQSTQLIVGATPSPDAVVLAKANELYKRHKLRRVYYSAFSPIPDADPNLPPAAPPLRRENRLYQADWLMRFYGFAPEELTTPSQPQLDLEVDPKLAWALRNRSSFPVNVNTASREWLLRVPGLGVKTVDKIVLQRRHAPVTLRALSRMGARVDLARYFVETAEGAHAAVRSLDSLHLAARVRKSPPRSETLFDDSSVLGGPR